jgi:hypothetical protein
VSQYCFLLKIFNTWEKYRSAFAFITQMSSFFLLDDDKAPVILYILSLICFVRVDFSEQYRFHGNAP